MVDKVEPMGEFECGALLRSTLVLTLLTLARGGDMGTMPDRHISKV